MKTLLACVSLLAACETFAERAVVEMKATGTCALANRSSALEVKSTSPAGYDLSTLRYCLCADATNVICRWKNKVGPDASRLTLNVPEGSYELRVTDGTWFYGSLPVTVLPDANPALREGEALAFRKPGPPPRRIGDFWRDMWAGRRRGTNSSFKETPRRVTCVIGDVPHGKDIPLASIDSTIADMARGGANELIFQSAPTHAEAWRAKLSGAGMAFATSVVSRASHDPTVSLAAQLAERDSLSIDTRLAPAAVAARPGNRAFVAAYRALPGVPFAEIGRKGGVRLRHAEWGTRSWFYLVNAGDAGETVTLELPEGTEDVPSKEFLDGFWSDSVREFTLKPGELRVFRALEDRPKML